MNLDDMMQKIEESEKAGSLPVTASLFTFLYFHLRTSKFIMRQDGLSKGLLTIYPQVLIVG